jgi:uncharacterized repeat protein (TIGR03803 family)
MRSSFRLWAAIWGAVASVVLLGFTARSFADSTDVHNFVFAPSGEFPLAALVEDNEGNLYGTVFEGGEYGYGAVFELTPAASGGWTKKTLYSFTGLQDGGSPFAGVIFDSAGNLYGTTEFGGNQDGDGGYYLSPGTVFRLSPAADGTWTETVLYDFASYAGDGQWPLTGLTFDSAGNLYGTTWHGGDGYGTVFELSPTSQGPWTETLLHTFTGNSDGAGSSGVVLDKAGNLYGVTAYGGDPYCNGLNQPYGCGIVYQLTNNGDGTWTQNILHVFTWSDGAFPFGDLVLDSAGNLYGTTPVALVRAHTRSSGSCGATIIADLDVVPLRDWFCSSNRYASQPTRSVDPGRKRLS